MTAGEPQFLEVGTAPNLRRIACRHEAAAGPGATGILWLIGLKSDMESTKATALARWARERGLGMTRFDYSGHGRSSSDFALSTTGDWIEEAVAVFTRVTSGLQILVGSSTGAHIALMLLKRLLETNPSEAARIKGLVLIAPAWDVSELIWRELPDDAKADVLSKGVWVRPSAYDPSGYPITRRFIEEGRDHLIEGAPFDPGRRIDVLQGLEDKDVPPAHARALKQKLLGDWVGITEVPDGDHRLAREEDLARLYALISSQLAA